VTKPARRRLPYTRGERRHLYNALRLIAYQNGISLPPIVRTTLTSRASA
jgi:hypothetical protein